MNIQYLSTFYPFRGGIAQFNAALYRALEKNHQIEALTFKRQYPNLLFPGETQYVTKDDNPDVIESSALLDSVNPFSWMRTASKIRKEKPELLLMKLWMPFFCPSLGYVAGNISKNTKSIAVLDNVIPHEKRFFDKPLLKYFLKRIDGFVVMSEQVREDLIQLKPDATYVYKQHPLYDHFGTAINRADACEKLNLDPTKKTLLFFGFIRGYKGLDILIDAFGKLGGDYQLVIAGESYGSFENYQKKIETSPNKERIHTHVRYISDEEVPVFFSAADVCVLPYKSATQSGITSIAYHFNLPMLATDVGGLKEMVIDGKTGKTIPKADVENIRDGILHFFNDDSTDYKSHILQKKKELSWEGFAQAIESLYKKL